MNCKIALIVALTAALSSGCASTSHSYPMRGDEVASVLAKEGLSGRNVEQVPTAALVASDVAVLQVEVGKRQFSGASCLAEIRTLDVSKGDGGNWNVVGRDQSYRLSLSTCESEDASFAEVVGDPNGTVGVPAVEAMKRLLNGETVAGEHIDAASFSSGEMTTAQFDETSATFHYDSANGESMGIRIGIEAGLPSRIRVFAGD